MDRKILARRQLRYVTILQDYLEKKLTNNGPLIPSATKHSIYAMNKAPYGRTLRTSALSSGTGSLRA